MPTNDADVVLAKFRDYITGPTRYATLLTVFELGIVAQLKAAGPDGMSAAQLAAVTGVSAHHVEQLLQLPVKDGFLARDPATGAYTLDGIARLSDAELARVMPWLHMIKEVCLRQLYHLTDSVREGRIVGLEKFYGFTGNFYQASKAHPELHRTWEPVMHAVTDYIDPWFYGRLDLPAGARVVDIAGNTGQGAILAQKYHGEKDIHVTCFDLPEKEDEALDNIAGAGLEDRCCFIGGDALAEIPRGFDVALIKHFLDMWDHDNALRVLRNTYEAALGRPAHRHAPDLPGAGGLRHGGLLPRLFLRLHDGAGRSAAAVHLGRLDRGGGLRGHADGGAGHEHGAGRHDPVAQHRLRHEALTRPLRHRLAAAPTRGLSGASRGRSSAAAP
ncbi:methyltransferase [Streptomyces sp. NPDC051133]|uniref:methyltransferase n=1 Tax=Streptomyces sp. NPDC051133 TaxID=3155521 RepID=UPI00343BA229